MSTTRYAVVEVTMCQQCPNWTCGSGNGPYYCSRLNRCTGAGIPEDCPLTATNPTKIAEPEHVRGPLTVDATGPGAVQRLCELTLKISDKFDEYPTHALMPSRDNTEPLWRGRAASELREIVALVRNGGVQCS